MLDMPKQFAIPYALMQLSGEKKLWMHQNVASYEDLGR